jgi:hypothetical protein
MFLEVCAYDLNLDNLGTRPQPGVTPRVSRQHPWIYRVADDVVAQT